MNETYRKPAEYRDPHPDGCICLGSGVPPLNAGCPIHDDAVPMDVRPSNG